jgi:hypothetical protein
MKNQDYREQLKRTEEIKAYLLEKGYVLTHLEAQYWLLAYEAKIKIVKIGNTVKGSENYHKKLSRQAITNYSLMTLVHAMKLVGENPNVKQTEILLDLFHRYEKVTSVLANASGVNNVALCISSLIKRGYKFSKVPGKRQGPNGRESLITYIYISGPKK